MTNIVFLSIALFLLQSFSFASERERTKSADSILSQATDSESLCSSSIELSLGDSSFMSPTLKNEHTLANNFLQGLKNQNWEHTREEWLQNFSTISLNHKYTQYPPYIALISTKHPSYYNYAVENAYRLGWILDSDLESWEKETIEHLTGFFPTIQETSGAPFSTLAGLENQRLKDLRLAKEKKFYKWKEKRDYENVVIINGLSTLLYAKTFVPNESEAFIKMIIEQNNFPTERSAGLSLFYHQTNLDAFMDTLSMFFFDDSSKDIEDYENDEEESILEQEIKIRRIEEDEHTSVNEDIIQQKADKYHPDITSKNQETRTTNLNELRSSWEGIKEKSKSCVTFCIEAEQLAYTIGEGMDQMSEIQTTRIRDKDRGHFPASRTRWISNAQINDAWRVIGRFKEQERPLQRSVSCDFSTLKITYPENSAACENDSDA